MHILIVGSSGVDRAAFIDRLISALQPRPKLYGYRSVKEAADKTGNAPIYIYPADGERRQSRENLLGWCKNRQSTARPEVFDRYACLIEEARPDGLLVMDEIGPMECRSPRFCAAILAALDSDVPVLAVVRDKETPFLNTVRNHSGVRCFHLTADNGKTLFWDVLRALQKNLT